MDLKAVGLVLVSAFCLAGCAPPMVRVTYQSVPEGAAVIENGRVLGVTPMEITYTPTREFYAGECVTLQPIQARWASGATADWSGSLCARNGYRQSYTFMRPEGVAGGEVDAQVGAGNQLARATQQAAQAQAEADISEDNLWMLSNAVGNAAANQQRPVVMPTYPTASTPHTIPQPASSAFPSFQDKKVTCTTTEVSAGQANTVCQ